MILLISAVFPPEPVVSANLAFELAIELSKKWKVKVITPKPSRPLGYSHGSSTSFYTEFEHIVLNSYTYPKSRIIGRMLESYSFGKYASRYISQNHHKIECIYLNGWPLLCQYYVVKAAEKYGIPVITQIMDVYPETLINRIKIFNSLFKLILLPIDKYVLNKSYKIITISGNLKNLLIESRRLDESKLSVIYNWQNEDKFDEYRNSIASITYNEAFTFMYLGSLSKTAAIDNIINGFKHSGLISCRLIIAGDGTEKDELKKQSISSSELRIEFLNAPIEEVPRIQDMADILILSLSKGSSRFALPSKLSGYMLSEKPIIACTEQESDVALIIRSSQCGWVVPPEDSEKLAETMTVCSNLSKDVLQKYGRNGYTFARNTFSREKNLGKLVNIINESIKQ